MNYSRAVDTEQVRQAYASVADVYIELFGSSQQVHAEDLAFIGRHLAGRPGPVLDLGCWRLDKLVERLVRAGFTEVERLRRPGEGDRRPHAALAARAVAG